METWFDKIMTRLFCTHVWGPAQVRKNGSKQERVWTCRCCNAEKKTEIKSE